MKALKSNNSKGAVLVIVAVSMTALLGLAGLAIDAGMGYGVKAKLNAALDAAGIAAAKASSSGASPDERKLNAKDAAERFFHANYPDGYLGSTPTFDAEKFNVATEQGRVIVDVSATAEEPTFFMRALGFDKLNVSAKARVIRQDLDMAFVVDNTGSLKPVGLKVVEAAETFIDKFNTETDRIALISFAYGAEVDVAIRKGFLRGFEKTGANGVITKINGYKNNFAGHTNFAEGFWRAREQLNSINEEDRSSLRVIVFFTDGAPNTFSSTFNFVNLAPPGDMFAGSVYTGSDPMSSRPPRGLWRYDKKQTEAAPPYDKEACFFCDIANEVPTLPTYYNVHDPDDTEFRILKDSPRQVTSVMNYVNVNRAARNLPEDMAEAARQQGIFVFTLGMGANITSPTGPDGEWGQDILLRMANDRRMKTDAAWAHLAKDYHADQPPGMYCRAANETELDACYDRLASAILRLSM